MKFFTLFILVLILTACSANPQQRPTVAKTGYPAPASILSTNGYPVAGQAVSNQPTSTDEPTPIITLDATLGTMTGVLRLQGQPLRQADLYLAGLIKGTNGKELAAGLDQANAPSARTDNLGKFTFYNVKPGRYGLIYDIGIDSFLLLTPDNQDQAVVAEVTAGNTTDLGVLNYADLPQH